MTQTTEIQHIEESKEFFLKQIETINNLPIEDIINLVNKSGILEPLVCVTVNRENQRAPIGSTTFMPLRRVGGCANWYNNNFGTNNKSTSKRTKDSYGLCLQDEKNREEVISNLNFCKITKFTFKNNQGLLEEPKLYTQINGLSNDTSSIAFLANDDFCMFNGNIVFCHIEKTENNKERMFYNIPVKLDAEGGEHLICNKDGSPTRLQFSRKGTKFLSHNLDNKKIFITNPDEFEIYHDKFEISNDEKFRSNDEIKFKIKHQKDNNGQDKYIYRTIQNGKESEWTEFDIKTAFYIPQLKQDVMWQQMIKKYPIMEKYKTKIFPKITHIVLEKPKNTKRIKQIETNIKNYNMYYEKMQNFSKQAQDALKKQYNEAKKEYARLKNIKYPSIDDLVKEFAEKTKNWKILQEFAKNTNNPTLYWKAVMKERQQRIKKHKLKPLGEQEWNNFSNLKPVKALNTNFGIGRK